MSAADFAHPDWLAWLAPTVALAVLGVGLAAARATRRLARFCGGRASEGRRALGSDSLLCLSLVALCAAAVGPRLSHRDVPVVASGVDVVLLFDVSRSMDAGDNPPSRIDRARRTALGVLAALAPGSRAALAAFGDRGVLLTPLSPDRAALSELVTAIDTDLVRPPGSNLADGLRAALGAFEPGSDRSRVLLVLSDGEVRPPLDDGDAGRLANAGARVVSVAFGNPLGSTIPDGGVPLRDARGEIAVTRRVLAPLEDLADATGGRVLPADDWGDVDLAAVVGEVERDARPPAARPGAVALRRVRTPTVVPFAAAAFLLLAGEALLAGRARPVRGPRARKSRRPRASVAAALAASLLAVGATPGADPVARVDALESVALRRPLRADEMIQLGVARYEAGRSDEARRALHAAALEALRAERSDWAAVAYHDLGVDALARSDLESARDFFLEAVALAPGQSRSRFNLEWTLRALARPDLPPPPSPGDEPPEPPEHPPRDVKADDVGGMGDTRNVDLPPPGADAAGEHEPRGSAQAVGNAPGEAAPGPDRETGPRAPLDATQRARWLARVADDPARALRSAVAEGNANRTRRPSGPEW